MESDFEDFASKYLVKHKIIISKKINKYMNCKTFLNFKLLKENILNTRKIKIVI